MKLCSLDYFMVGGSVKRHYQSDVAMISKSTAVNTILSFWRYYAVNSVSQKDVVTVT